MTDETMTMADMTRKLKRVANYQDMIVRTMIELGNDVAALQQHVDDQERIIQRLQRERMVWHTSPDGGVVTCIGPDSGRLYSIVPQHNDTHRLDWPGGSMTSEDRDGLFEFPALIEQSWVDDARRKAAEARAAAAAEPEAA